MPRRKNMANNTSDSDYLKGYYDGMKDTYDSSEFDAYYAGVGFGKMQAKDKHLGFNSNEERQAFERGIENKDKHFKSIRAYRSFWERFLGIGRKERRSSQLRIKNSSQNVKRVKKNWKGGKKKYKPEARPNNNLPNNSFSRIDPGRRNTSAVVKAPPRSKRGR